MSVAATPLLDSPEAPSARAGGFASRPMLVPAAAFIVGVMLSECSAAPPASLRAALRVLPLLVLAAAIPVWRRASPAVGKTALGGLLALAGVAAGFERHRLAVELPADHVAHLVADERVLTRLAGRIVTVPELRAVERPNPFLPFDPPPRTRFVLDATELRNAAAPQRVRGLVRVSIAGDALPLTMGDSVQITGWLYRPSGPQNPGEFDWARWSRLQNIHVGLSTDNAALVVRQEAGGSRWWRFAGQVRARARSLLLENAAAHSSDEVRGMLDAMVLGQRSAAGRAVDEAFLRTGAMHFLSVSGFHVGVLWATGWWLARSVLRRGRAVAAVATIVLVATYAFVVAEPNAPILRAGTMGILASLAILLRRTSSALNWLALAAVCVLVISPLELFRPGFQLSFALMVALLTVVPALWRRMQFVEPAEMPRRDANTLFELILRRVREALLALGLVCIVCWVVSLPLTMLHFGRFAPWGALQAMLITPLAAFTIACGFVTVLIGLAWPAAGAAAAELLGGLSATLLAAVQWLARLPGALLETPTPPGWLTAMSYALLAAAAGLVLPRAGAQRTSGTDDPPSPRDATFAARVGALRRSRPLMVSAVAGMALAIIGLWGGWLRSTGYGGDDALCLHVLSVGHGSAALLVAPGGEALVFDAGTLRNSDAGETVVRAARALGVPALRAAAISHSDFDHYSGIPTILERLACDELLVNPYFDADVLRLETVRMLSERLPANASRRTLRAGDGFMLGEAQVDVLWPDDDLHEGWSDNDRSLVLLVRMHGVRILLSGDMERGAIRTLLSRHAAGEIDLLADVLIAPHHGAVVPGETAALLAAVDPAVIIVSTARPRPRFEEVVRATLGEACRILSTESTGAVAVRVLPGGGIAVQTPFAGPVGVSR